MKTLLKTIFVLVLFSVFMTPIFSSASSLWQTTTSNADKNMVLESLQKGDIVTAEKLTKRMLANHPLDVFANYHMAVLHFYNGRDQLRDNSIQKAVDASTDGTIESNYVTFVQAVWNNNLAVQQKLYIELKNQLPDDNERILVNALNKYAKHQYAQTIDLLLPCADQESNFELKYWLVSSYYSKGDFKHVIDYAQKFLNESSDNVALEHMLGQAYLNTGQYAQSVAIYEKLLKEQPDNLNFHCCYGKNHLFNDQPEKAIDHFKFIMKSLDKETLGWKCYWNIATCYTLMGDKENTSLVLSAFLDKCKLRDNQVMTATVYNKIADFYFLHQDYEKAAQGYNDWMEFINNSDLNQQFKTRQYANYYCNLIQIAVLQDDGLKVESLLKDYNELQTSNSNLFSACELLRGMLAFHNHEYSKALELFEQAEQSCEIVMWKARVVEKMNNFTHAQKCYQQILDQKSSNFYSVLYKKAAKTQLTALATL